MSENENGCVPVRAGKLKILGHPIYESQRINAGADIVLALVRWPIKPKKSDCAVSVPLSVGPLAEISIRAKNLGTDKWIRVIRELHTVDHERAAHEEVQAPMLAIQRGSGIGSGLFMMLTLFGSVSR
jgi:hypothetical protein